MMWTYFRNPGIEFGVPDDRTRMPLRPHVHAAVQVMVITKGSRRVSLGGRTVSVAANAMLVIPSGVAHAGDPHGWQGFNAYIDPSVLRDPTARILQAEALPAWTQDLGRQRSCSNAELILSMMAHAEAVWSDPGLSPFRMPGPAKPGWPESREGHIRRYQREAGIAPRAHVKAKQLDEARHRIARGEALCAVAADLGFADQSHLGRQFKAAYGTSPGRYSAG